MISKSKFFAVTQGVPYARWFLKRPLFMTRILRGYMNGIVFRKPQLRQVDFVVNWQCNSSCVMCFAHKNHQQDKHPLTVDEIRKAWKELRRKGAFIAIIQGGEPTLRPDLDEIILALDPRQSLVTLTTNSISLTRERVRELRDVGLSVLALSLESIRPKLNDQLRGYENHCHKVMQTIGWAKEYGLDVILSCIASKEIEITEEVIKFARDHEIGFNIGAPVPGGKWADRMDILFGKEEWENIRQLQEKYRFVKGCWNVNYFLQEQLCPGGREKISIGLYGDITSCTTNPISFGNIREESIDTIYNRISTFYHYAKQFQGCLVSIDHKYIREYLLPIAHTKTTPINISDHPKRYVGYKK